MTAPRAALPVAAPIAAQAARLSPFLSPSPECSFVVEAGSVVGLELAVVGLATTAVELALMLGAPSQSLHL